MCCLFGLIDYANSLSVNQRRTILNVLSRECEARGTDATGIAYNVGGKLKICKRPVKASRFRYTLPADANFIMGHTRMTTQGSEKNNINNHPFSGIAGNIGFALAHNGILRNDRLLRINMDLPETKIETDSYIAVQLLEKSGRLDFESISDMAEKVEGSFCFTVLTENNELYLIKGNNPLVICDCGGFYVYASTSEILRKTLEKLGIDRADRIDFNEGQIMKINSGGEIQIHRFEYDEPYGSPYLRYEADMIDEMLEYAESFGIDEDDVLTLYDMGFDVRDIECLLSDPEEMQELIGECRDHMM